MRAVLVDVAEFDVDPERIDRTPHAYAKRAAVEVVKRELVVGRRVGWTEAFDDMPGVCCEVSNRWRRTVTRR